MDPVKELKNKYPDLFSLKKAPKVRLSVTFFDKFISGLVFIVSAPLWVIILVSFWLDGLIHPHHKGSLFASYLGSSRGKVVLKPKLRIHREDFIDQKLKAKLDYAAYPKDEKTLTCVGRFLKATYLDELPQFFSVFKGDISLLGPRFLALKDCETRVKAGHTINAFMKAGLISQTHVRKGTRDYQRDELNYQYMRDYMTLPGYRLIWINICALCRGLVISLQRRGRYPPNCDWKEARRVRK